MSKFTPLNNKRTAKILSNNRRKFAQRRRKRKFIAGLLSALFPGLGHLYLGLYKKGISLIYFMIIDLSALLYFSSVRMQINVPLLILLVMLIPVVYFYNVFDVLQSVEYMNARRRREERLEVSSLPGTKTESQMRQVLWNGLMLVVGGVIVSLLHVQPKWLAVFFQQFGVYACAGIVAVMGIVMIIRECMRERLRTGRFTSSLLLITVGLMMYFEKSTNEHYLLLLLTWWPLFLIIWGIEYVFLILWHQYKQNRGLKPLHIDIKGSLLSMFLVASIFLVTQQDQYLYLWNKVSLNLTVAGSEFSEEKGFQVEMDPVYTPISWQTDKIAINNINGRVEVITGDIDVVKVETTMWIDEVTTDEAKSVAEEVLIQTSEGQTVGVTAKDRVYGATGKRHPRMNLVVTIPTNRIFDIDISTTNGVIKISNVKALHQIAVQTGNGNVTIQDIIGDVSVTTLNGNVGIHRIFGNVTAETKTGTMVGSGITGSAALSVSVGDIYLTGTAGDIRVNTKNGNIKVDQANHNMVAESLNGKIKISTPQIGGDWTVYSAVGVMNLELPEIGDYTIQGSSGYGNITTTFPFEVSNKEIYGVSGTGEYLIQVEGNSNLYVNKY